MSLLKAIHSRAAQRASYEGLLVAMALSIFVAPILVARGGQHAWMLSALFLLILLSCLAAAIREPRGFAVLILLVVVLEVVAGLVMRVTDTPSLVGQYALRSVALGLTAYILLRDLMRSKQVTADTILGAVCVYLLLGLLWGQAYAVVEMLAPGSFAGFGTSGDAPWSASRIVIAIQYFSFVTQTTLGYGDVVPVGPCAQSMALMQAITGQFYLAIIVARFVALFILRTDTSKADADG